MKKILILGLAGISLQTFGAEKIDYEYCKDAFAPESMGGYQSEKGFPFSLSDDGKIKPHKKTDYKFDKESNTETISYEIPLGLGVYGKSSKDSKGPKSILKVVIKRDKSGKIIKVIQSSKMEMMQTNSGLGSKNPWGNGAGMYGPGIGGYPGFGGGYGFPSETTLVHDVKYKSGKCFPYRNVSMSKNGNHTHKMFNTDVELCRDLKTFFKEQEKGDTKLGKLKSCYDSYQKEAQKILDSHLKRNDDLYNPDSKSDEQNAWGEGGFPGGGEGVAGGGGYGPYGPGGFGMSIDSIVQSPQFDASAKAKMMSVYCDFPYGPMKDMVKDDSLFVKEVPASNTGEGSGAGSVKAK